MDVKILISGDCAVTVQMGNEISLKINQRVRGLLHDLEENPIEGITEMVPTYASLMIHYRPEIIRAEELSERLKERIDSTKEVQFQKSMVKEIPVCYGGELGPDLQLCAQLQGVTEKEIIRMHSEHEYYTFMLGFAPGHPYMARFKEPFCFKRRETPRVSIPAQSVVVQQNLSDLIPFPQPCGWNIIGATPLVICDFKKEDPFLVHAGDWIRYVPVSQNEYEKIKRDSQRGTYKVRTYTKEVQAWEL